MFGDGHRVRRPRPTVRTDGHIAIPPMDPVVDLSERVDLDAEMLDVEDGLDDGGEVADDGHSLNHDRFNPGYVTRGPGFGLPLAGTGNANASGMREDAYASEGDASRSASAEGVGIGVLVADMIPDTDPVISGKRKR